MKKKIISCIMVGLLICLAPTTAFAGTWVQDPVVNDDWKYLKDNGSYAKNEWVYDNGSWYYFTQGIMHSGGVASQTYNNLDASYCFSPSGAMVYGGFADADSTDMVFAEKNGHLVGGLFMVDGVLYEADLNNYLIAKKTRKSLVRFKNSKGEIESIDTLNDHGKILTRDGKPFASDSKVYKSRKYIPKYDSKGNLIGAIQN